MEEKNEIVEAEVGLHLLPPRVLTIGVAVKGNGKSKYLVRWALDKFISEENLMLKLLHVSPRITFVPTPMGNYIPVSQVRDDVAAAYKKEVEWQTRETLLPYKNLCTQRKIQAEILLIESDDVANAIAQEVLKSGITKLVIGAPSRGTFTRKVKKNNLSSRISVCTPSSCTVYAVSSGKLSSIRPSDVETNASTRDDSSETCSSSSSRNSSDYTSSIRTDSGSVASYNSSSHISDVAVVEINSELEKLRVQLRHVKGLYATAQTEAMDASRRVATLDKRRLEEAKKLREISAKEETAKELARLEKGKYEAAIKEAGNAKDCANIEASRRQCAEMNVIREVKEKERLENALMDSVLKYQKFEWEEIVSATLSFSDDLKIGIGAYGTVYKCSLHHTTVAVKVLRSKDSQNIKEFKQELEILSKIRHPHLLLLIGACIEQGCLVYEYMENGSLEDRLHRRNNGPPIPWFERYRIAWEVASALVFLHSSKPKPIIHRDLKPANILLDHNFVSKIGDVGLSTVVSSDSGSTSTEPVGTLCYIDPEYQRTGLVSPKCDVYAFGIVVLQLLTAKPAMALFHAVETAIRDGRLAEVLDSDAGNWPIEETNELALLGLQCSELQRKDRPDLQDQVLPVLERLKEFACRARDTLPEIPNRNLLPNYNVLCAIMEWKSRKQ